MKFFSVINKSEYEYINDSLVVRLSAIHLPLHINGWWLYHSEAHNSGLQNVSCVHISFFFLWAAPFSTFIISRKLFSTRREHKTHSFKFTHLLSYAKFLFQIDGDIMDKKVLLKCLAAHFYVLGTARAIYRKWYDFHSCVCAVVVVIFPVGALRLKKKSELL